MLLIVVFPSCYTGTLLLDDSLRGQLYTREIWIQDMSKEGLDTGVNVYE